MQIKLLDCFNYSEQLSIIVQPIVWLQSITNLKNFKLLFKTNKYIF